MEINVFFLISRHAKCYIGCNSIEDCVAFGFVNDTCFMCHNDTTGGERISGGDVSHFVVWMEHLEQIELGI